MKDRLPEYAFVLIVGSLYIFAINTWIIAATLIVPAPVRLFLTGLVALALFIVIIYNRRTMLFTAGLLAFVCLLAWMSWESWKDLTEHGYDMFLSIRGELAWNEEYDRAAIYLICMLTGLPTALFMYKRFNFYVLAVGGVTPFILSWVMNYTVIDGAFLIFLFCFCMLLVRKMNYGRHSIVTALIALPVCLLTVVASDRIPSDNPFSENTFQTIFEKPLNAVYDMVYLWFNPKYFTFQSTGFTGAQGQLGGAVSVNYRAIMEVEADSRMYLSGLTKDSYNGRIWADTLQEGALQTSGFTPGYFEMLETAAALLRKTAFSDTAQNLQLAFLRGRYLTTDAAYLRTHHFPHLAVKQEYFSTDFDNLSVFLDFIAAYDDEDNPWQIDIHDIDESINRVVGVAARDEILRAYLPLDTAYVLVDNRTGTVFRPPKKRDILFYNNNHDYNSQLLVSAQGDLRTSGLMERYTGYDFSFLNVDTRLSFVQEIFNESRRGAYRAAGLASGETEAGVSFSAPAFDELHRAFSYGTVRPEPFRGMGFSGFTEQVLSFTAGPLAAYADSVYAHYTALPDTLPARVYSLAHEITEGYATDYERVIAIENYLLQIPYTLTPPPVPAGADFVDYFLFEAPEGYCTYFASAMAVLSRCVGVPARYAEGYLTPPAPAAGNWFTVTNANAHAWAEVYLEGYGWLIAEATSPYRHALDRRPASGAGGGRFAPSFGDFDNYEDYLRSIGIFPYGGESNYRWGDGFTPGEFAPIPEQPRFVFRMEYLTIFFVSLIPLSLLYILWQHISERFRIWRIKRMPVNTQTQIYFRAVLKMAAYRRYPMRGNETPQVYGARIGKRFGFMNDTAFMRDLVALYYKARYGLHPLSGKEADLMRTAYSDMVSLLRYIRIKPRFMFIRYVRKVTRP